MEISKAGWIRNRGKKDKCPVPTGVYIDVRYRDGTVEVGVKANVVGGNQNDGGWTATCWSHTSVYPERSDIMAWKPSDCEPW